MLVRPPGVRAKAVRAAVQVSLGRSTDWVFFRADDWTVALQIEKDRRFPAIEAHIPEVRSATRRWSSGETDAAFLDQAAQRLPGASEMNSPVTLDLNGAVVIVPSPASKRRSPISSCGTPGGRVTS